MTHRIAFLGSPEFAVPSLRSLLDDDRFDIQLVVTQPDRKAGRGRKLTPPAVAQFATAAGLRLFQPHSLRDDAAIETLAQSRPDLLVVVAYGEILHRRVLALAERGAINVHPSLLPKYRGASPVPAAILSGDTETGVSIMKLVRKLDAGPIISQQRHAIQDGDTSGSLLDRLADVAAEMLPDVAHAWVSGSADAVPQEDSLASYTREWTKSDARIDWNRTAVEIERLVRAALPWPVAWTEIDGQRLQVREAAIVSASTHAGEPGTVSLIDGHALVSTGSGQVELLSVQPASKRPMAGNAWARNIATHGSRLT